MTEERTREPSEVLQAALLEMVNGARAVLDVVEELVTDPSGVARVVETTFGAMRHAADAAASTTGVREEPQSEEGPSRASRVTRIRVQ